ncbi:MAG TPA: DciA family protein [Streptosporangiaceae bacterium]
MPDDDVQRRLRSAREALAAAMDDAKDRGDSPARVRPGISFPEKKENERAHETPAARKRAAGGADPQPLGEAIRKLLADRGWQQQAAVSSALGRWDQIVGPEVAAHATPGELTDGELVVIADSTAWATQLRLLAATLVRKLNAELGDNTVRRVKVRGPTGPPAQPGALRVRGGRGPRDTYG